LLVGRFQIQILFLFWLVDEVTSKGQKGYRMVFGDFWNKRRLLTIVHAVVILLGVYQSIRESYPNLNANNGSQD
jgi:hypothetical protein